MNAAMSIALSGLMANTARLRASASNVANMHTRGVVPETPPSQPVPSGGEGPQVYQAISTQLTPDSRGGGVRASYGPALPSYAVAYDPTASYADEQGLVATPTVGLAREAVDQIVARQSYKANIATIKTAEEMERTLLDLKT